MNFITVAIYQRVYLLNFSNTQGRILFIFINTKNPACNSTDGLIREKCLPSQAATHLVMTNAWPPPLTLLISRPGQMYGKPPAQFTCSSNPQPGGCPVAKMQHRPQESGCTEQGALALSKVVPGLPWNMVYFKCCPGHSLWGYTNEWGLEGGSKERGYHTECWQLKDHLRDCAWGE